MVMVRVLNFFCFCCFWVLFPSVIWLLSISCYFTLTDVWLFYTVDVFVLKGNASLVLSHRGFWEVLVCLYHVVPGCICDWICICICAATLRRVWFTEGLWEVVESEAGQRFPRLSENIHSNLQIVATQCSGWKKGDVADFSLFAAFFILNLTVIMMIIASMTIKWWYWRNMTMTTRWPSENICLNLQMKWSVEPGWPWIPLRKFVLSPLAHSWAPPFSSSL